MEVDGKVPGERPSRRWRECTWISRVTSVVSLYQCQRRGEMLDLGGVDDRGGRCRGAPRSGPERPQKRYCKSDR